MRSRSKVTFHKSRIHWNWICIIQYPPDLKVSHHFSKISPFPALTSSLNRQFLRQKKTSRAFWNIMRSNSPVMKSWKVFHDILHVVLWRFMSVCFVQKSSHSWCSSVFFCAGNTGCFNNLKNGFLKITRTCSMTPFNCTVWPSGRLWYYFSLRTEQRPNAYSDPTTWYQ